MHRTIVEVNFNSILYIINGINKKRLKNFGQISTNREKIRTKEYAGKILCQSIVYIFNFAAPQKIFQKMLIQIFRKKFRAQMWDLSYFPLTC